MDLTIEQKSGGFDIIGPCLIRFGPDRYHMTTAPLSQAECPHAEDRGGRDPAVRMWEVDPAPICASPSSVANHWLPAPRMYRSHHPLVRQSLQEDSMRDHRNDRLYTAAHLLGGADSAK